MERIIKFLLGEGELDGVNYGERPGNKPMYWWRTELRKEFESIKEENERLRAEKKELLEALNRIAYSVKYMQMEAEAKGAQLNGSMAIAISNDPNYLKEICRKGHNDL
jgi:regulator of replication initiation timing